MLNNIKLSNILFLDIETVSFCEHLKELPEKLQYHWARKAKSFLNDTNDVDSVYSERAAIFAEFGRIICISTGFFTSTHEELSFRVKSFFGHEEKSLLTDFSLLLQRLNKDNSYILCAHNGKEFDFPYIARRMLVNSVSLPEMLDIAGKKPWEVNHLDTMELWKFGDYKHYTSLDLLTQIFGIPSPKGDFDGSLVGRIYYQEKDLQKIVEYCQRDVVAIAQLFLKYRNEPLMVDSQIQIITP